MHRVLRRAGPVLVLGVGAGAVCAAGVAGGVGGGGDGRRGWLSAPVAAAEAGETRVYHPALRWGAPRTHQQLIQPRYACEVDYRTKTPAWVVEYYEKGEERGKASRDKVQFKADERVPAAFRASLDDYRGSGFSRGHLAPAGSHKTSAADMESTFLLSANIVPQELSMNGCDWYRLEQLQRDVTRFFDEVHVVSGPCFLPAAGLGKNKEQETVQVQVVGKNRVHVPTHMFKVILASDHQRGRRALAAFLMPNRPIRDERPLSDYLVDIGELAKAAGIDFFPELNVAETVPLCAGEVCMDGGDKDKRVRLWRLLGLIKTAKSENELDQLMSSADKHGFDVSWLRKMYMDEAENRRKQLLAEQAAKPALGPGGETAPGRQTITTFEIATHVGVAAVSVAATTLVFVLRGK